MSKKLRRGKITLHVGEGFDAVAGRVRMPGTVLRGVRMFTSVM